MRVDATRLHLLVHHIPVVLSLAGAVAVPLGLLLRRSAVTHYGALSLVLAGATAPFAYLTGRLAAGELLARVTAEGPEAARMTALVDAHGALGLAATLALVGAGAAGVAWLGGRTGWLVSTGLVVLGLASAALAVATGREGGWIRHGDTASAVGPAAGTGASPTVAPESGRVPSGAT